MYIFYNKKIVQPPGCINKILLIMKLTTLLLMVFIMQVSATTFAQRVTLSENGTTLKKVFDKISNQTGYDFLFADATLKGIKPVSIQANNEELKIVLDRLFDGQPLVYTIEDKAVVISKKEPSFLETVKNKVSDFLKPDSTIYKGRVYNEKDQPLVGATIFLKGATNMSISNEAGYFQRYGTPTSILRP